MYLIFGTRLDIAFVLEQLSKHNANSKKDIFELQRG